MNQLSLTINQQPVTAAPGTSILDAATVAGIAIPTLCFDNALEATGSCWMCIVEIKGKNLFVPACHTEISEGMVIETENETLTAMRRQSLERIIRQHGGDCLGPCELNCPAGCNIPEFVAAIAEHQDRNAIEIIKKSIPLPGILGRICPAPCEDECRRHGVDKPVSICALKRYAADTDMQQDERFIPEVAAKTGKKVAIIGSGPTGLSAAYFLLCLGHEVTIFESGAEAGGMMRYGIPRFRLPETVIESDLATLCDMGVEFCFNTTFGKEITLEALRSRFDALLLAVGAQKAATMQIPGEDAEGVTSGIDFLRKAASGVKPCPGERVVVTGGGNTAIDAARTALRLGASSVTILYRRSRKEMPANRAEIEEALAEGVSIIEHAAPILIRQVDGTLEITALTMRPGEPDESGRCRPIAVDGSEFILKANTLISAIGQEIDPLTGSAASINTTGSGKLQVDSETLQSAAEWIFAGGDCVTGTDLAIRAVAQGKRAAHSINLFLQKEKVTPPLHPFNSSYGARDEAPEAFYKRAPLAERVALEELSAKTRTESFMEVVAGYSEEDARKEAERCLQCRCNATGDCRLRELATRYTPLYTAEKHDHQGFYKAENTTIKMEREKCVDCGICVRTIEQNGGYQESDVALMAEHCPTGALSLPL